MKPPRIETAGIAWRGSPDGVPLEEVEEFRIIAGGDDAPIVTVANVQEHMGSASSTAASWDEQAQSVCGELIDMAQASLETKLGRPITVRTFTDEITVPARFGRGANLHFPRTPVVEIISLKADGVTQVLTSEYVRSWGIVAYGGAIGAVGTVVGEYRAGIDGTSTEHSDLARTVKAAVIRQMERYFDQAQGVEGVSDEGYTAKYIDPDRLFTDAELRALSRYRHRKIAL